MPSCHKRTATPAEILGLVNDGRREMQGGRSTEARPEEDFVDHCGCEFG